MKFLLATLILAATLAVAQAPTKPPIPATPHSFVVPIPTVLPENFWDCPEGYEVDKLAGLTTNTPFCHPVSKSHDAVAGSDADKIAKLLEIIKTQDALLLCYKLRIAQLERQLKATQPRKDSSK